jgi:NADH:ubiquinone oxidoreductase subunit 5 (subunit L)/multisubunit Na+/H+ antiporter MnhA subunit
MIWLIAALFGSAFTLASFIKLIHAIFLGQWSPATTKASEVRWMMWVPTMILAGLCIIFGVFANELPLKYLVFSAIHIFLISGVWSPAPATLLLLLGIVLGGSLYWIGQVKNFSVKPVFIGGETIRSPASPGSTGSISWRKRSYLIFMNWSGRSCSLSRPS